MKIAVISCSLHPESRSFLLARAAVEDLEALGAEVAFVDLRETDLPLCDGFDANETDECRALAATIDDADAVLLAAPIYHYDVNAAAKNLVELTGRVWEEKLVGFLCAAGGRSSYMAVMSFANGLMLNFRCLIVPRFVYATRDAFTDDGSTRRIGSDEVRRRVRELAETTARLARALASVR